jgi:predicted GNAT family N-acyltransferase
MMNTKSFHIRTADYSADIALLREIRDKVFVQEQNVPIELEWDEVDKNCDHVLAIDALGNAIGTGRLTPTQTIGRMAVLATWRGKGVGDALLLHLIALARQKQLPSVSLHAQIKAIGFYQKHGFSTYGPTYLEAGIVHQSMTLALT